MMVMMLLVSMGVTMNLLSLIERCHERWRQRPTVEDPLGSVDVDDAVDAHYYFADHRCRFHRHPMCAACGLILPLQHLMSLHEPSTPLSLGGSHRFLFLVE